MFESIEKWRVASGEWLDLQDAADILRETKNDVLAEITTKQDGKSHAEKDRMARISPEWVNHRSKLISAESAARRAKMRVKYFDMIYNAKRSKNADARAERGKY